MKTNLLIVESPAKARRLATILDPDNGWVVAATYGDLMDLPSRNLGLRFAEGKLELHWRTTLKGRKQLSRLRAVARTVRKTGGQIYVGTAPDREGETLAAHVMQSLQLPKQTTPRVLLYSLEAHAIKRAIARPGRLNGRVVAAQEARRGLDRAVGYELARRLRKTIGRVQAPVLKACAVQAAARKNFRPSIRYRAGFMVNETFFALPLQPLLSEREALKAAESKPARRVVSRTEDREYCSPPAACTTTDVLKVFSDETGVERICAAMKSLFVDALITYPRTDSRTLDRDWVERVRAECGANGRSQPPPGSHGGLHGPAACEAIRPTSTTWRTPASLENDEPLKRRLYEYIAWRAFAACAEPAQQTTVTWVLDNQATGTLTREDVEGWRQYRPDRDHQPAGGPDPIVWSLKRDDPVKAVPSAGTLQTPPPDAPTVAWLLNWMEKNRVGRPSTYAPCLSKLLDRKLVRPHPSEGLVLTPLGLNILGQLSKGAECILLPEHTRALEEWLDEIARRESGPEESARLVLAGVRLASGTGQVTRAIDLRQPATARHSVR
ncbi:MAG: type IA DNA topoisomerase [Gammaproteobacteria bacterium]|nr:type IA DNA topoisomerase [Gammaproteobacteria bacterium]